MKSSQATEILALFIAGMAGVTVSIFGWVGFIIGGFIMALDSYFIIPLIKKQTIREYLEIVDKTGENKNGK